MTQKSNKISDEYMSLPKTNVKTRYISRRLTASLILMVTLLTAMTTSIFYFRAIAAEDKALQTKADEYMEFLVNAIKIPIWNIDQSSVQLLANGFIQNELITRLVIWDEADKILFSFDNQRGKDGVRRSQKINYKDNNVGEIELVLTQDIYKQKSRSLLLFHTFGILLILICILMATGYFIRIFLDEPLKRLNKIVQHYASGDYHFAGDQLPYHEFKPFETVLYQMGMKIEDQLKSLQEAEKKYRAIFEHAVEGIYQSSPEGMFRSANPAMAVMLGYEDQEDLLRCVTDIQQQLYVEPSDRDDLIRRLEQRETVTGFETQMYRKDRSCIWVLMNVRAIKNTDGVLSYMEGFVTDISDRVSADREIKRHRDHLEELVAERTDALAEAKEQAEAANVAKSDFLARMSHEIRTPLNAVTGLTNVVLKSELTSDQRDYLNKVLFASKNLMNVINDILDFSKVEAGQMLLANDFFDLDQVLERLADLFGNRTSSKDLELIFAIPPDVPRQYIGDKGRLMQILTNLIENGIKFTAKGEIVVGVELADSKGIEDDKRVVKFQVRDTGIGIPPHALPTLFDPFTQADDSLTREHQGTGLGLAICQKLVELMDGRIWAQSTEGHGSTFYFNVVLEAIAEPKPRYTVPADLIGLKTLVVDDNAASRQMLKDLLTSFSFNVTTMDNGNDAVAELRKASDEKPYQLVLLDWQMPGIDGVETARQISEITVPDQKPNRNSTQSIENDDQGNLALTNAGGRLSAPILILVTAYGHNLLRSKATTDTMDAWLAKPVKPSQLFNTIMELLDRKEVLLTHTEEGISQVQTNQMSGRRVLVVEDSELNQAVIQALVEGIGLKVEIVENGKMALERLTRLPWRYYDAVLMDIQMPVMDGYAATRAIRQWESVVRDGRKKVESENQPQPLKMSLTSADKLPIIALTAHALAGEKEKCFDAGMDDYLSKPIDEKQLEIVLLKWVAPEKKDMDMDKTTEKQKVSKQHNRLDVQGALKRLGGRKLLYDRVLQKFVPECKRAHEIISKNLADGDPETGARMAHTVKGASAAIGATTLSQVAQELEKAINEPDLDPQKLLLKFERALKTTLIAVDEYLSQQNVQPHA